MTGRTLTAIAVASLCATAGVAGAKPGAGAKGSPIDGTWQAKGVVTVARHISDAKVGDHVSRTWSITTACAKRGGQCHTLLSYRTSSGHQTKVTLRGAGRKWAGSLANQTFACTNGGTATGSISFKLHVTGFVKGKKRRVAGGLAGTGTQAGTGCAVVKEIVAFKVSRQGF